MNSTQINTPKTQGSIANTLKFWFLIFSLVPLTLFALFSYHQANTGISHLADQKLRNTSILAARFVKNWLDYRMFDIINQADLRDNRNLLIELSNTFKQSNLTSSEFVKSENWKGIVKSGDHELQRLIEQYDYIANLFLVDIDGNVLYTQMPNEKLGSNLFKDDMGNVELSTSIKQVVALDTIQFSNKTMYDKTKNTITGFMIAPIHDDNSEVIGSFVMQIRFNRIINALIVSTGSSLTHYLVGDDAYLRSAYKNSPGELLKQSITTEPVLQWLKLPISQRQKMKREVSHYKGPEGNRVIGIIHTIQIANISWALVSEIDEHEAMQVIDSFTVATIALELFTILAVVMLAHLLISRITNPIIKLRDAMINIASGAKSEHVKIETNDEISTLAHAFNHLLTTKREYEQTLLENTRKIELVLDSTAAGTWDWFIQTKEISLSEQWAEIIGYDLSELGLVNIDTWMDLVHPDDRLNSDIALHAHWDKKTDRYLFESRVKHKNGDWVWVQDTGQVIEWHKDGSPKRMVGTRVDVNDRKHSEQELKKLSRLARESTNGVIFANIDGEVEWINEGFTRLSGYSYNDIKDKKPVDILSGPKTDSETTAKIKSAIENAQTFHVQILHYHKSGTPYWVDLVGNPLRDDADKLEGFISIATDINDQKVAGLKLARQQDMLEQMSLLGSIGAWEVDLLNNKLYWSSMTKKIHEVPMDYQPELSSALYFYKEGEARDMISHHVQQGIESGKPWNIELPLITAKGKEIWVAATGKIEIQNGKSIRMFGSFQDITVRKNIENEIIKAKNTAESATEAKNEFLATMSHEIRTPMNAVIGMLNLLCRSELNKKQHRQIEVAKSSAQSLLSIINDILDFSKVEAGKMDLELLEFNLHDQMSELAHAMALKAEEKGIEFILDLTAIPQPWVKGDAGRLRQIFTNLVSNAIKFTQSGEIIVTCKLEDAGEKYIFHGAVSDTGIGVPKEKHEMLFQFFTQVDASATRKFGGTGLGLAIVQKLCMLMNGKVNFESNKEKGSCFKFFITLDKIQKIKTQSLPQSIDVSNINTLSILVVDDNLSSRQMIVRQLTLWGANDVEHSSSSSAAIDLCQALDKHKTFDVALIDMHMPGMNGPKLRLALKNLDHMENTRFILMTPMYRQCDEVQAGEHVFDGHLTKPITVQDLRQIFATGSTTEAFYPTTGPLQPASQEIPIPISITSDQSQKTIKWPSNTRILLVDDNAINQEVACGLLEDMHIPTGNATSGLEAIKELIDAYDTQPYTLVLMDCQMPEMDGYEATKQIRLGKAGTYNKDITIIAVTANAMKGDKEKCLQAGMSDYISKPLNPKKLETKLQQWLLNVNDDSQVSENAVNIWDYESLLRRVRGKDERVKRLVEMFIADMPSRMNELKDKTELNQHRDICDIAHTIKGVAGNLGALTMQKTLEGFELAAKSENSEKLLDLLPTIQTAYSELETCLNNYLEKQ